MCPCVWDACGIVFFTRFVCLAVRLLCKSLSVCLCVFLNVSAHACLSVVVVRVCACVSVFVSLYACHCMLVMVCVSLCIPLIITVVCSHCVFVIVCVCHCVCHCHDTHSR